MHLGISKHAKGDVSNRSDGSGLKEERNENGNCKNFGHFQPLPSGFVFAFCCGEESEGGLLRMGMHRRVIRSGMHNGLRGRPNFLLFVGKCVLFVRSLFVVFRIGKQPGRTG